MKKYFQRVKDHFKKIKSLPLLAFALLILPILYIFWTDWSESSIYIAGIVFQISGIGTIAVDLYMTQKQYGTFDPIGMVKKYYESTLCWIKECATACHTLI